jgi:hypothetical protein
MPTTADLSPAFITAVRELIQAEVSPGHLASTLPAKLFAISAAVPLRGKSEIPSLIIDIVVVPASPRHASRRSNQSGLSAFYDRSFDAT